MSTGSTIAIVGVGLAAAYVVRAKLAADGAVAAAAAAIVPKSSLEKVLADVSKKGQQAAAYTAEAILDAPGVDFASGLVSGPGLVEQAKDLATLQRARDAGFGDNVDAYLRQSLRDGARGGFAAVHWKGTQP